MEPKFKPGDLVRYGDGPTALIELVNDVRFYGIPPSEVTQDRERRFIEASQRPHGVLVNNLLDTEDRLRALKNQVRKLAAELTSASQ